MEGKITLSQVLSSSPRGTTSTKVLLPSCLCLVIVMICCAQKATSVHNLRIQVNNENLQSPPYLLDAVERIESAERERQQQHQQSMTPVEGTTEAPQVNGQTGSSGSSALVEVDSSDYGAPFQGISSALTPEDTLSEARSSEETIEEMLNLEPESVLKLSPANLMDSVASHDELLSAAVSPQQVDQLQETQTTTGASQDSTRLKSQLPVTGSHLKRPLLRVPDEREHGVELSSAADSTLKLSGFSEGELKETNNDQSHNYEQSPTAGGAKSRVSPSVASEEQEPALAHGEAAEATSLEKKVAPSPPDTWEPNQIMAGVTNVSHVPATVRRQYGHQTRTRITLGGGYQRNKLPAVGSPPGASDDERATSSAAAVALERPVRQGGVAAAQPLAVDSSRVIEVPERIVLPASVFKQATSRPAAPNGVQQSQSQSQNSTASIVRKRDSRCPSNGVIALEHPGACDKFILCEDGYSSERTCPNGLMYGTRDVVRDNYCVHRWQVVCGDKSMPNPISSPGCRWQNGIFNVQGSPKCTPDFYECTDGVFVVKKCPLSGQVYDDKTKSCQFAEQVGCAQEALAEFRCPADDQTNTYWPFPRYFLNERALIHCVNDKPEIIRCRDHERVDPENLFCVPIDKAQAGSATDETGGVVEVTARRTPGNSQRERAKKVKVVAAPVEDDHSNE